SIGGLTQIVPLFFQDVTNQPIEGMKPRSALEVEGRDVFIANGCVGCHSQMIRPLRAETERYGVAPVLSWQVNDATRITFEGDFMRNNAPLDRG
ncbi:cbb3-type cytochrome c oxidase subunit II, partial [Pseudomonas syringae pv. japonica str. M301072]